jgi:hypothetical protein
MTEYELRIIRTLAEAEGIAGADLDLMVCRVLLAYNSQPSSISHSMQRPLVSGSVYEYLTVVFITEEL